VPVDDDGSVGSGLEQWSKPKFEQGMLGHG
jgi:hypothetical protein